MSTVDVLGTIALLVLVGIALVVAAVMDRRRGREIERDLGMAPRFRSRTRRRPPRPRG